MIVNQYSLLAAAPIKNMLTYKASHKGVSHGLTECGYDIRIAQNIRMFPGRRFVLASTMEEFQMPRSLMGRLLNKSTWARMGLDASMTTNIEPGWKGFLTLELRYAGWKILSIPAGVGIAQVIFDRIEVPSQYEGKYQNQPNKPIPASFQDLVTVDPY